MIKIYNSNLELVWPLVPCLFPGIHFPGNHFPYFPMFGKHKENWSKKLNSGQRKKKAFMSGKCFPFLILRKTLSFSQNVHWSTKGLIWWGQDYDNSCCFYLQMCFIYFYGSIKIQGRWKYMDNLCGLHLKHFFFV